CAEEEFPTGAIAGQADVVWRLLFAAQAGEWTHIEGIEVEFFRCEAQCGPERAEPTGDRLTGQAVDEVYVQGREARFPDVYQRLLDPFCFLGAADGGGFRLDKTLHTDADAIYAPRAQQT